MLVSLVRRYFAFRVKNLRTKIPKKTNSCPRCGGDVTESKKGFFCKKSDCRFGLWRDNKFLTGKKITLTKKMAAALLKDGILSSEVVEYKKQPAQ